jgi:hypothetical protein
MRLCSYSLVKDQNNSTCLAITTDKKGSTIFFLIYYHLLIFSGLNMNFKCFSIATLQQKEALNLPNMK